MDATSDSVILLLDEIVREGSASTRVRETLERVQRQLAATDGPMAWETVPLSVFAKPLPGAVRSCWVFVLRAGAATGAERHPNRPADPSDLEGATVRNPYAA